MCMGDILHGPAAELSAHATGPSQLKTVDYMSGSGGSDSHPQTSNEGEGKERMEMME